MRDLHSGMNVVLIAGAIMLGMLGCQSTDDAGDGGGSADAGDEQHGPLPPDRDEPCDLRTDFEGDELCIAPPKEGTGIQVHVGPSSYTDPKAIEPFLIQPGEERTECYYVKAENTANELYFPRKIRMRPGSHHLITYFITTDMPDGWGDCGSDQRMGSLGGAETSSVDYPTGNVSAPENADLGKVLPKRAQLKVELHHINATTKPILREAWINVYWKPKDEIKTLVQDMFMLGGLSMNVPPGKSQIYHNSCTMGADTRLVDIFGHFHAHTTRFSAWRTRGDQKDLFYEVYDWHDTPTIAYDTATENAEPNRETLTPGGMSGVLEIQAGDVLEWECEIHNDSEVTLRYSNELYTAEMCNLFGTYTGNSALLGMCQDFGTVTNL